MPPAAEETLSDILRHSGYFDAAGNLRIAFVVRDRLVPIAEDLANAQPTPHCPSGPAILPALPGNRGETAGQGIDLGRRGGRIPSA